jgi:hypothetical protein
MIHTRGNKAAVEKIELQYNNHKHAEGVQAAVKKSGLHTAHLG